MPVMDVPSRSRAEHPGSLAEVGRRLETVLDRLGGRQKASSIAGRSTDQLWKYTRGKSEPPFLPLARLCAAALVRLEWLATGEGDMLMPADAGAPALKSAELTAAIELAAQVLQNRTLPAGKYAELVSLIYEGRAGGLPETQILRFARLAAS